MSIIVKNNIKKIVVVTLVALALPLLGVVMKVIYAYGTYVGTYARTIIETGICK